MRVYRDRDYSVRKSRYIQRLRSRVEEEGTGLINGLGNRAGLVRALAWHFLGLEYTETGRLCHLIYERIEASK